MDDFYKARELLVEYLEKDLVGPDQEEEELTLQDTRLTEHYISGILYPRTSKSLFGDDDQLEGETNNPDTSS